MVSGDRRAHCMLHNKAYLKVRSYFLPAAQFQPHISDGICVPLVFMPDIRVVECMEVMSFLGDS